MRVKYFKLLIFSILLLAGNLSAKNISVAVFTEDLSGGVGEGSLRTIESTAEAALCQLPQITLVTRTDLNKVLDEQELSYRNIVNDRARLGRLLGVEVLVILSITKATTSRYSTTNSAFGITETIVHTNSDAAVAVKALEVESGRILTQFQLSESNKGNGRALEDCILKLESNLKKMSFDKMSKDLRLAVHKLTVKPTSGVNVINGLDLFIDGNFVGNTPLTTEVEEGVHEVTLRKGVRNLWSNQIRVVKEVSLGPNLSD